MRYEIQGLNDAGEWDASLHGCEIDCPTRAYAEAILNKIQADPWLGTNTWRIVELEEEDEQ